MKKSSTKSQGPKQLLLSFDDRAADTAPILNPVKKTISLNKNKPEIPEFLLSFLDTSKELDKYLHSINVEYLKTYRGNFFAQGNSLIRTEYSTSKVLRIPQNMNESNYCVNLVYFDEEERMWINKLEIFLENRITWSSIQTKCYKYNVGKWSCQKTVKMQANCHFIQPENELADILKKHHPYAAEWAEKMNFDVRSVLMAHHLEILDKAGFEFVRSFKDYTIVKDEQCVLFNRLCQYGTKPKDIFKTSKIVYTVLKKETRLEIWDVYRKLMKLGKIGPDSIQQAYDNGYSERDLEYMNSILAKKYENKPIFTWDSLVQYLGRLDTFEAISNKEAIILLKDYLTMCSQLNMKPRVDGDSLKREHDIAARNCRLRRNEMIAIQMQHNCEVMKKYDYSENLYFVRSIRNYDDLLDEANQQHNCVASYGGAIAKGTSYIYVMREVAHPERSLITIELSPKEKSVRQKFLAYNRPIHNKSQSEFIDRWIKKIKSIA